MDISLFLAQVFALYFIVAGISIMAKQDALREMVRHLANNSFMLYFAGFFVFILGSLIVLSHNVWDGSWRVLITVVGWLTLLKGASYLLLPQKTLEKWVSAWSNNKSWMMTGGLIMLVVGLYLAYIGFLA